MTLVDRVAAPKSAPLPRHTPSTVSNSRFDRAVAYVATVDPAISGQGGHNTTWRVARKCAADFELSEEDTFRILTIYNLRCVPPWSERELRHKAHDAAENAHVANPVEERPWVPPPYSRSADDSAHAESDAPPDFDVSGIDQPPREGPSAAEPLRGLAYLGKVALIGRDRILELAATAVDYVWVDIAVAGTIVLIAGPPAEGKTTLLFLILAARMNPGEVVKLLGRSIQPAPQGMWIVLIEGEHSESSTSRKLVKSLDLLGLDHAALDRVIIVARKAVLLGSPEWLDVVTLAAAGLVSDIAIDTVARVAPADPNDERQQK